MITSIGEYQAAWKNNNYCSDIVMTFFFLPDLSNSPNLSNPSARFTIWHICKFCQFNWWKINKVKVVNLHGAFNWVKRFYSITRWSIDLLLTYLNYGDTLQIRNWNSEMLVFEEKTRKKNLSEQGQELTTNSTHIWRWVWELNPGHIGERQVLSPLRHPCSPQHNCEYFFTQVYLPGNCRASVNRVVSLAT